MRTVRGRDRRRRAARQPSAVPLAARPAGGRSDPQRPGAGGGQWRAGHGHPDRRGAGHGRAADLRSRPMPAGVPWRSQPAAPTPPQPATAAPSTTPGHSPASVAPGTGHLGRDRRHRRAARPVTRRVIVQPAAGLAGAILLDGGQSYLEVDQDGAALASVSGTIADAGETIAAGGHARAAHPGRQRRRRSG